MNRALDYVCIFTGGSIRGASYVGAIKAMEQLGVNNKCFVGSSVGSIMAVFYAVGYSPEELEEIFNEINFDLFKDINISFGKDFSISKGTFFLEWLKEKIESKYYKENYVKGENPPVTFKDIDTDVVILTTDLYTSTVKVFSKETTPDYEIAMAVRISSSMPGLLKPVSYNGHLLIDGDLSRSWPIWKVVPSLLNYNTRILEFRLEGSKERHNIANTSEYLNIVYTTFSNFAADHVISTYKDRDKFDYIRLDAKDVNITDFNLPNDKKQELYNIGYRTTMDFFTQELPEKRKKLLPHYKKLFEQLEEIKQNIINSKYIIAKNQLNQLFVDISKVKKVIDLEFYNNILDFYESFTQNIFLAFGVISLIKNKRELIKNITTITNKIENKISEIEIFVGIKEEQFTQQRTEVQHS